MPGLLYSGANLATVAYAEVLADGSSPNMNSGVETGHPNPGEYTVTLPVNDAQPDNGSITLVTPKGGTPCSYAVEDSDDRTKTIRFEAGGTAFDTIFEVVIMRSTITPPSGSPG